MKKPIIVITLDYHGDNSRHNYSTNPWYALRRDYSDIVSACGGLPVFVSYEHSMIEDVIAIADGLIIPGGDRDVHPQFYGQKILSPKVQPGLERASYEIELMKCALKRGIPFLGICNGMQILNVTLGGTLIQDIPTFRPSNINHLHREKRSAPAHSIEIVAASKLSEIAGREKSWMVNSTHHQAIDVLGKGLIASAIAPDGIIEAIESSEHEFVFGVEWHPEYNNSELDKNLFLSLIKKARR